MAAHAISCGKEQKRQLTTYDSGMVWKTMAVKDRTD